MNIFTLFVLTLLILSIANNILMYNKCYISRNLPTYDSHLKSNIGFLPINIYYPYQKGNEETINKIKKLLSEFNSEIYVTYGSPSFDDYIKINEMSPNVKTEINNVITSEEIN